MPHYNELTKLNILVCILWATWLWLTFQILLDNFTVVLIMCCPWLVRVVGKCAHYILIKFIVCHHWHCGCETWTLNDQSINRVNVAWNNSFRHIFYGFWWESVKPLQYYTATLPISYFIDQRKLLFWKKNWPYITTTFWYLFHWQPVWYYNNVGFSWSN